VPTARLRSRGAISRRARQRDGQPSFVVYCEKVALVPEDVAKSRAAIDSHDCSRQSFPPRRYRLFGDDVAPVCGVGATCNEAEAQVQRE